MKCILCNSKKDLIVEQSINKSKLIKLYKKYFNIDVTNIINCDILYIHCKTCDLRFFIGEDGIIKTGNQEFYNSFNKLPWYYFDEKYEYKYVANFIKDNYKILEVGCGKAAFIKFLPDTIKKQYTGLELSTDAKNMAKTNGVNIENINIEEYAKTSNKNFDITCSFQVLEHVANPRSFIESQISLMNRGGGISINNCNS